MRSSLKYLDDFMENKERYVIDMFTNAFLKLIGRYIYLELTRLTEKTIKKGVKLLQVLLDHVLPEISIVKLKISLFCLFSTSIPSQMRKCFETKTQEL